MAILSASLPLVLTPRHNIQNDSLSLDKYHSIIDIITIIVAQTRYVKLHQFINYCRLTVEIQYFIPFAELV